MGSARAATNLLVLWIALHATRAQKVDTGADDHGPQVQIHMKIEKQTISPFEINPHLKETVKTNSKPKKKSTPTEYLGDQSVSSVLFNEIDSLVLTKSSFRLISYLSLKPYHTAFLQIQELLEQTLERAESYLHVKSFPPYHRTLQGEPKFVQSLKDDSIRIQLTELTYELDIINKNFNSVKTRFSQITGNTPILNHNDSVGRAQRTRNKRSVASSIFKFLFGADDNSETIQMLKDNIATLMANDQLQESRLKEILESQQLNAADIKINRNLIRQMTKELAQVNVTLTEISQHTQILFTLASFQVSISQLRHRINIIRDSLFGLQINLDILYHHFSAMVTNKLTPEMIPPSQLLEILKEVKEDIRDHPKLSLPEDLTEVLIYKYYKIIKFEVTIENDFMLGVLQTPLIETNKRFRLYKLYNLPLPLPGTNLQVQYNIHHQYLAITKGDQYVAFPSAQEIMGCQLTSGAFCELNTALLPTLNLEICEFSLYKKQHEKIMEICEVTTSPFVRDTAISLEPNFWVVVTQNPVILHVNCLKETTYLQPQYPIDILHLEDGCEATAATLVLPGHSRLVKEDQFLREGHAVQLTLEYEEFYDFQLVKQIIPHKLTPQQLKAIGEQIPEPQTVPLTKLKGQLLQINQNYPYQLPLVVKIIIAITSTILGVLGAILAYKCYKHGCSVDRLMLPLTRQKNRKIQRRSTNKVQYISEYNNRWRQHRRPLRSSVVIQEVEMQPMVPSPSQTGTSRSLPPAIEAAQDKEEITKPWQNVVATPDSVARALQDTAGINFEKYYKKKRQRTAVV